VAVGVQTLAGVAERIASHPFLAGRASGVQCALAVAPVKGGAAVRGALVFTHQRVPLFLPYRHLPKKTTRRTLAVRGPVRLTTGLCFACTPMHTFVRPFRLRAS